MWVIILMGLCLNTALPGTSVSSVTIRIIINITQKEASLAQWDVLYLPLDQEREKKLDIFSEPVPMYLFSSSL